MRQVLRSRSRRCTALLALWLITAAGASGCQRDDDGLRMPPPIADDVDPPSPEELLGQMSEFMNTHGAFAFDALVTYEAVQESGQKLEFDLVQRIAVSQPDRLYWVTLRDDGSVDSVWYSDGTFTMLKQPDNIYGQIDGLGTIAEMIDVVVNEYGLVVPFADLLASGSESVFLQDLESSMYAGLAWVDGRWAHHIALRNDFVDFQLWIPQDGDPVPQRLRIIWRHEEGLPGYVAQFRKWKFSPSLDDSRFEFVVPPDAERIDIIPLGTGSEWGY
jgi:hypothetical protein